jgi:hypothetical protein
MISGDVAAEAQRQPPFRLFAMWLDAFNSGDPQRYATFLRRNFPFRGAGLSEDLHLRERTGGFDLLRLKHVTATQVTGWLQERESGQRVQFELTLELYLQAGSAGTRVAARPYRIVGIELRGGSVPPSGGNGANRLTLTDDSCAFEGNETPSATETFEAEVVNKSSKLGAFEIAKIDPGHTFDEVKSYVKSQQQRIADGLAFVAPPIWMTLGERAQIESGQTGKLVSSVTTGTWVLWCAQEHPPTKLFLIEPALEISA